MGPAGLEPAVLLKGEELQSSRLPITGYVPKLFPQSISIRLVFYQLNYRRMLVCFGPPGRARTCDSKLEKFCYRNFVWKLCRECRTRTYDMPGCKPGAVAAVPTPHLLGSGTLLTCCVFSSFRFPIRPCAIRRMLPSHRARTTALVCLQTLIKGRGERFSWPTRRGSNPGPSD